MMQSVAAARVVRLPPTEKHYPFQLRHVPEPTIPLPIACRSTGHYSVFAGWHNPVKTRHFVQIFWGIKGSGKFVARGKEYVVEPGQYFVLYPGDPHDLTAITDWEHRWMTLDGLMPEQMVRGFGLGDDPVYV